MTQALYRKWRPRTWDEVVGQEHVIQTLRSAVRQERLSHAYLFAGPRGTGKTTTARILAKASNCLVKVPADRPCNACEPCVAVNEGRFLDLIEIDAASNTSVDDVRDLRDRINFAPNEGRNKVYIVDEVHMLSTAAFNALLKTLEEPPPHAIFILATTEVHKVPATVLSRCQRHEFRRIPTAEILAYLEDKSNEAEFDVDSAAMQLIARQATGSLRDGVSLLDQLVSMGRTVTLEGTREVLGTAADEAVGQIVQALMDGDIGSGLTVIDRSLDAGVDSRQFARQIVGWLRDLLIIRTGDERDVKVAIKVQAAEWEVDQLLQAIKAFSNASRAGRTEWQPGLALELAFLEAAQARGRRIDDRTDRSSTPGPHRRSRAVRSGSEPLGPEQKSESQRSAERETPTEVDPGLQRSTLDAPPTASPRSIRAPEASDASGTNFQTVLNVWSEVLAAAYNRDPQAQALLNSSKPLEVRDNELVLGFQSDLLRDRMEMGHNRTIITEAIQEVIREPVGLRCVLLEDWDKGASQMTPTAPPHESGVVAAALRDLGAEVVDYGPITDEESLPARSSAEGSDRVVSGAEPSEREASEAREGNVVQPDQAAASEDLNEEEQ